MSENQVVLGYEQRHDNDDNNNTETPYPLYVARM